MDKYFVSFGEIMLRLTPPDKNAIANTDSFSAYYGGSESNVLVSLSSLGNKTRFVSALPQNDVGISAIRHLARYGVDTSLVKQKGDTMGMYFLEDGFGERPAKVIYARKHAEITYLTKDDFDFDEVFSDCGLFHISGISFALSDSVKELCFEFLKEAKKRQILVSFDFNYRSKLWTIDEAKDVFKDIIKYADIVFCSEKDLEAFLSVSAKQYFDKYHNTKYLIVREREILQNGYHKIKVDIHREGAQTVSYEGTEFAVLERIGGGDAFDAGVLHALMKNPENLYEALQFGSACFVLKHTVKGDVLSMTEQEIYAYLNNNISKDVKR